MTPTHTLITCAFALDRIIGRGRVIDAYYGGWLPDESAISALAIEDIAESLSTLEMTLDPSHRLYDAHTATLHALRAHIQLHTGAARDYAELYEETYSSPLSLISPASIEATRECIVAMLGRLGYHDPWPECLRRWRTDGIVSASEYQHIIDTTRADVEGYILGEFLGKIVGEDTAGWIREHSSVRIEVVDTSEPWSGYHYYHGDYRSTITINAAKKLNRHSRGLLLCHEAFPGHHLEAVLREKAYQDGQLDRIATLNLLCSERSVMSEGWGDYGIHFAEHLLDEGAVLGFLDKKLSTDVVHNTSLALINGEIDYETAVETIVQEAGSDRERAIASLRFSREWFLYFPVYSMGYDIVRRYVADGDPARLRSLYLATSLQNLA